MQSQRHSKRAFTILELIVIICIIAIVGAVLLPIFALQKQKSSRIGCVNRLKQIGTAYRIWSGDSSDAFPTTQSTNRGGWREILEQTNAASYYFTNYVLMQNELGQSPKILICPFDERQPAADFNTLANTNISYFLGADSHDMFPQSILAGDRNLAPGTTPKNDYGFSPANGKGNDVWIKTNSSIDPVCWSLKMHSEGNPAGVGNILLGDGSVQQVSSAQFRTAYQMSAASWGTRPEPDEQRKTSFRLIFP
jgi:type II secretory pathway pseudopilin PulG